MDVEEEMYYYDDDNGFLEDGYMEQQAYEQYPSAAAAGRRYVLPQERLAFRDQYRRCLQQLMFEKGENGMTTVAQLGVLMGSCLLVLFTSCLTTIWLGRVSKVALSPRSIPVAAAWRAFLFPSVVPLTSLVCGSCVVYAFFGEDSRIIWLIFGFATIVYVFIYCIHNVLRKSGVRWRVGCLCFTLIFIMQYLLPETAFLRIRGILMIMTMKLFSLASDLETNDVRGIPGPIDFYGYCIGVSSVMFGPWMPYQEHVIIMKQKNFKSTWKTIRQGIFTYFIAFMCLLVSSCFLDWFIPEDYTYYSVWLIAFRDAMSFRYSHYFVSYTAEGSLYLSGYLATPVDDDEEEDGMKDEDAGARAKKPKSGDGREATSIFGRRIVRALGEADEEYPVTNALFVELPRSLVDVVVNWNIPMHAWLKKYVFIPTKEYAGYFFAVFFTYSASSLLHGFNFQISMVLLSLGIYTYAEHVLREKLAKAFSACIRARRCRRGCDHFYDSWNIGVMVVNFSFFVLSVFHLTYLGMVFDSSEVQEEGYNVAHTLRKWSRLNFASHYTALGLLVFAKII